MFLNKNKNKQKEELRSQWGKPKNQEFDFDLISIYSKKANHENQIQFIDDRIVNDIDVHELFTFVDRTSSSIGEQYLYNKLLSIEAPNDATETREKLIEHFMNNEDARIEAQLLLSKLDQTEAYYVSDLFLTEPIPKPKWFWVIELLCISTILILVFGFFRDVLFFFLFPLLIVNLIIHFWNKKNIFVYIYSIPQLLRLCEAVRKLIKLNLPFPVSQEVLQSLDFFDKLKNRMAVFRLEAKSSTSELHAIILLIIEYIKILFLIEPITVFNVLDKIKNKRKSIETIYKYFAEVDVAMSIVSLRSGAPYYCKPEMTKPNESIHFTDIYHPMIPNCVANSLHTSGMSILLTGSNMSGKTTFIRTVAINTLLAQTMNTCFAHSFAIPLTKIFTAIRMSDSLFDSKSYYLEEVRSVKKMIDEGQNSTPCFFLLDELFRGTNTTERIAAGKAVLSYLASSPHIVFVATHDIELVELLKEKYNLYHFTEVIENETITFDYKLKSGSLTTRNAIRILELNDYPQSVIADAKNTVDLLENLTK